ncbi:Zinc finger protein SNAI2 [Bagarius yarrelli]|uniref:Zinc finger protein SNAI2 n=1 Tax=Bagarius yarrelli TaxID=175774 RepID=A0A556TLP9_BAGYA|nr:Zinc finger protein SNAI2 [Bagarius yarrelli]
MPRSFLVKKHLSHKKPNYGMLDSQSGDSHTQVMPVWSSCPELLSPYDSSFIPGPCLLNQDITSVTQKSSVCGVSQTQPLQDSRLSSEGHTCTLPISQSLVRACAASQRNQNNADLQDRVMSNVTISLLGLASKGNTQEHFECFDCHKTYFTFSGLAKHRQLQCEWPCTKYFSCKYCDKEYVSLGALKMHIRTHTLPCVSVCWLHCTVCYDAVTQLLCHLRLLEDTFRPYVASVQIRQCLRVSVQAEVSQEAVCFLRHPSWLPAPASLKPVIAQATSNCVQALLAPSRAAHILLSKRVSPL